MIAGYNHNITSVSFPDQAGNDTIGLLRAPFSGATIKGAYAMATDTVAASGTNYYTLVLQNGGTAGTDTAAIGTAAGTAGVTAETPEAFSLNSSAATLDAGEWLKVAYTETGTVAPGDITVVIEWVNGKG